MTATRHAVLPILAVLLLVAGAAVASEPPQPSQCNSAYDIPNPNVSLLTLLNGYQVRRRNFCGGVGAAASHHLPACGLALIPHSAAWQRRRRSCKPSQRTCTAANSVVVC